jgi:hypothetical protein
LGDEDLSTAWRLREGTAGKPLTVILDQAEEVLDATFRQRLGFREEWLAHARRRQ